MIFLIEPVVLLALQAAEQGACGWKEDVLILLGDDDCDSDSNC